MTRVPMSRRSAGLLLAAGLALAVHGAPPADRALAGSPRQAPGAGRALGIPTDGLDRVRLSDGRVMTCRVEEQKGGILLLRFETFTATVKRDRILEIRRFADYDSTPRNEEEKGYVARGMVRHGGRWLPKESAEKSARAEEEEARKFREEEEKRSKWENRWQVDTEHFHIEANIPRDAVDHYADLLEIFYGFFTKAFGIQLTQREKKKNLPVFLFRRRDEFMAYHNADVGGKSENLLGYFVPAVGQERLVFFDAPGDRKGTEDVMFHEGTHFIIHLAEPKVLVSRWVHEGCAEYFAGSTFDGKKFVPGQIQDGRLLHFLDMVGRDRVLTMDVLMRGGNPYKDEASMVRFEGEHYAQAWTLVHYLMEGKKGRYRKGFVTFLNMLLQRKGKFVGITGSEQVYMDLDEAKANLARCLGIKDVEVLVDEIKEYAKSLPLNASSAHIQRAIMRRYMKGDAAGSEEDFRIAREKAGDDVEALSELARAYMNIPEYFGEAVTLFRRALELDPLNAENHYFLALLLNRTGSPQEAMQEVETCLQVDPDHGLALAMYAWLMYATGLRDRDRAESEEEVARVRKAIKAAERSIVLDPSSDAFYALAALNLAVGEFEKARDASKAAAEMEPENKNILWQLCQCYALLGQSEDFARILRRIELLLRRENRPAEGETAREGAAPGSEIQDLMGSFVRRIVDRCLAWQRWKEASLALDSWYAKKRPRNEEDWIFWADVFRLQGERARAAEIASEGLKDFPDSDSLKSFLETAGKKGAGEGGQR